MFEQWDKSKDVRHALLQAKPIDELKKLTQPSKAVDTLSDAKKAFDASIDRAIKSLNER